MARPTPRGLNGPAGGAYLNPSNAAKNPAEGAPNQSPKPEYAQTPHTWPPHHQRLGTASQPQNSRNNAKRPKPEPTIPAQSSPEQPEAPANARQSRPLPHRAPPIRHPHETQPALNKHAAPSQRYVQPYKASSKRHDTCKVPSQKPFPRLEDENAHWETDPKYPHDHNADA